VGAYMIGPDTGVPFMCVCACVDGRCVGRVGDWMDEYEGELVTSYIDGHAIYLFWLRV
jgi:hypothetical protein